MLKWRDVFIEDQKTLEDSETPTIDLKVIDPISALTIMYVARNGSVTNLNNHLHDNVSKIELVDGSDVLHSLSMLQNIALNFYEQGGKMPPYFLSEKPTDYQWEMATIFFGRYLGDRDYYLDPTKFRNLQLKPTHNLGSVRDVGTDSFESGTGRLSVIAHIMEEVGAPAGFMMAKNHYDWTTAASGDERIDLPRDYPYRLLMVRAFESQVSFASNITDLKLSIDQDKRIPFDMKTWILCRLNERKFGLADYLMTLYKLHDETFEADIGDLRSVQVVDTASSRTAAVTNFPNGYCTIGIYDAEANAVPTTRTRQIFHGKGGRLHNTACYPFGDLNKPEEWFDAPSYGSVRLIATQGNEGGAASVVLQQPRSY